MAVGDVAVGRQQNHLDLRGGRLDLRRHVHAVAVGQLDVAQHHVGRIAFEQLQPRSAILRLGHVIALERDDPREQSPQLRFVVDNQHFLHKKTVVWGQRYK